jgi:hypothetical protein
LAIARTRAAVRATINHGLEGVGAPVEVNNILQATREQRRMQPQHMCVAVKGAANVDHGPGGAMAPLDVNHFPQQQRAAANQHAGAERSLK